MKIIYYEGLFGIFGRWLKRGILKDLEDHGFKIEYRHWLSKKPIVDPKVIVIGHSFGAMAANRNTHLCRKLITLDCRNGNPRAKFKTNLDAKIHTNYYQQSKGLKGYPIEGANNIKVASSHGRIASLESARDLILNLWNK